MDKGQALAPKATSDAKKERPSLSTPQQLHIRPLGHASVLFSLGDFHWITDPVLGDRIGFSVGKRVVGQKRLQPPAMRADELPPIQVILLSHSHFDHTDVSTLKKLPKDAHAVVQQGNGDLVKRFAKRDILSWGETTMIEREGHPRLKITSIPSRHWGARVLFDRWRGWGGYLMEFPEIPSPHWPKQPLSVLFAGDTAQTNAYKTLHKERDEAPVDVAVFPIGAYDPWIFQHCSPEQAWDMATNDLKAAYMIPIHYNAFPLSNEPPDEPMQRLLAAAGEAQHKIVGAPQGTAFNLALRD